MYFGALLMFISTPLLLGSFYGLVISLIMLIALIQRIFGEEKMLINELEGYSDYKNKVKYRLIPYIW